MSIYEWESKVRKTLSNVAPWQHAKVSNTGGFMLRDEDNDRLILGAPKSEKLMVRSGKSYDTFRSRFTYNHSVEVVMA